METLNFIYGALLVLAPVVSLLVANMAQNAYEKYTFNKYIEDMHARADKILS